MKTRDFIYRCISGEASEADRQRLEQWLAEDPENREEYESIKYLHESPLSPPGANQASFGRIRARVMRIRKRRSAIRYGALLLILSVGAWTAGGLVTLRAPTGADYLSVDTHSIAEILAEMEVQLGSRVTVSAGVRPCPFTGMLYGDLKQPATWMALFETMGMDAVPAAGGGYVISGTGCGADSIH